MDTIVIGFDLHKRSNTAVVLDECEDIASELRLEAGARQVRAATRVGTFWAVRLGRECQRARLAAVATVDRSG